MGLRFQHAADWPELVGEDWPREILSADLTDRLHRKQGRSIARWTLTNSTRQLAVFVKRHYRHSFWKSRLPGAKSDAIREWHHLEQACLLGVPVPRAVACAEWSRWPGRLQGAIVLEELRDMVALHEAIPLAAKMLPSFEFERWKAGLIAELVRLTKLLHDRGYVHRDLYLCHFFIPAAMIASRNVRWAGQVVLIDWHRLARVRLLPTLRRAKDLGQLLFSAQLPGITKRDVVRFWRLYRGDKSRPVLRRLIAWKWRRYQAHNRKHGGA
jgi:heptose I phosphotransferase